ncbi:MAG TPA: glycosyltransferase family 1 protein [Aliiroseovarius sp.]|nr:glycosyltransferase family 1 protein [Aliiroseovarius sp.]
MRILIAANTSWYIHNFRRRLISTLLEDGHEVLIAAPPDPWSARLAASGCRFIPLEVDNKGTSPIRDAQLIGRLKRMLRETRPELVFTFTIKPNIYMSLAARGLGIPTVPNVSGLGTAFLKKGWLNRLVRLLYRQAFRAPAIVFFQNRDDQAMFLSQGLVRAEQARLLPGSGVDLSAFAPVPLPADGHVTFLLIARMLRDKGIGEFVEAARQIRKDCPQARFRLLGFLNAENRSAIQPETIDAWVAEGIVEYLGAADDVRPHIAAADCVVLPSYREGTPRSLLEAAAMARPVITTDAPGCRDVVEAGTTGFLCAPRDADSLTQAVRGFIDLPCDKRREMGLNGRRKMERDYDEAIVIRAYQQVIRDLGPR